VLCERFFKRHVLPAGSLLHYLLPDRRHNDTVSSLNTTDLALHITIYIIIIVVVVAVDNDDDDNDDANTDA